MNREEPLATEDLERLAMAAYLTGHDAEAVDALARAHQKLLHRGSIERAVRSAFWLSLMLMHRGERARASGWVARATRLLAPEGECVEQGYLLVPLGFRHLYEGETSKAHEAFRQAAELGARYADADLAALGTHCRGRVLIRMGKRAEGARLLDEAMAAVEAGDVSPIVAGDVYCSVIEGCLEVFDLRRAQEWTSALTHWCESQPELVPYRGQCMIYRAEILQLRGDWAEAMEEAERACAWLAGPPGEPAAGAAFYQRAELHRLRGKYAAAEEAYRAASEWGKKPQPGLAQLRLAQGEVGAAAVAIRQALIEAPEPRTQVRLLTAAVDILIAAGDVAAARVCADELQALGGSDMPALKAMAARAYGAVLLAEGEPEQALVSLRRSWTHWQELEAPYEAARVRLLIGAACGELGDVEAAALEVEAARRVFEALGAAADLALLEQRSRPTRAENSGTLTPRELQVLRLVARGKTNRAIASELAISEKTVARHVSNIFLKIGVSTRAAATAHAYEHELV